MRKTTAVLTMLLAAGLVFAKPVFAQGIKIAVIDVNKILNESNIGKAARKKMETRYAELKKKIETVNQEARKMKEDLDKQKILLGKEKVKEKEGALSAKVEELRKLTQASEKEMRDRQKTLTQAVLKIVEKQIDKVVAEEHIDLLIDKGNGVVRAAPSLEITDKVLSRVNQEKAGGK